MITLIDWLNLKLIDWSNVACSRERSTLLSLVSLAKDNVMYVEAFMNHLENPASQPELLKV